MAVRGAWVLLCLFGLVLILCDPQRQSRVIYGAVNGSVTFPVAASVSFREILWKKGPYPVIQWEVHIQPEPRTFWPFVGRISLDTGSGDLSIFSLTHSDEDEYELESPDIKDDIKFHLNVIDPLPSVTLNCTWTGDTITVQCRLEEPYLTHADLLQYSWLCSGAPCPHDTRSSEMYLEKNRPPEEVTCVARNPLSERKSSMDAATCVPVDRWRSRWFLLPAALVVPLLAAVGGYRRVNRAPSVSVVFVQGSPLQSVITYNGLFLIHILLSPSCLCCASSSALSSPSRTILVVTIAKSSSKNSDGKNGVPLLWTREPHLNYSPTCLEPLCSALTPET